MKSAAAVKTQSRLDKQVAVHDRVRRDVGVPLADAGLQIIPKAPPKHTSSFFFCLLSKLITSAESIERGALNATQT